MKNVLLGLIALISFNYATPAFAQGAIEPYISVGIAEKEDELNILLRSPNGVATTNISCDSDEFSSIEVEESGKAHWQMWSFESHDACLKALAGAKKATRSYPAVIVLIDGKAYPAEYRGPN